MNIFVSNISFKSSENDLRNLFSQHGEVASAKIITDKLTGRSRGFGFVEMPNNEEANQAISQLNGYEFMTKVLNVNEARPREEGERRPNSGGFRRNDNRRDFGR